MPFILENIRNGQETEFSIRDLLLLIGDPINDEIKIGKKKFRISSCQELSSGSPSADDRQWIKTILPVSANGQTQFNVSIDQNNTDGIFMVVNNLVYDYNHSFYIVASKVYWTGDFALETTDSVYIKQLQHIPQTNF
jgi:hypothetical protein